MVENPLQVLADGEDAVRRGDEATLRTWPARWAAAQSVHVVSSLELDRVVGILTRRV